MDLVAGHFAVGLGVMLLSALFQVGDHLTVLRTEVVAVVAYSQIVVLSDSMNSRFRQSNTIQNRLGSILSKASDIQHSMIISTKPPSQEPVQSADQQTFYDIPKAEAGDFRGRFREIVLDPINLLIERDPRAGTVENGLIYLHNGNRVPASGPGAYYGNFSDILIINRGVHEPLEEYLFQEVLCRMPGDAVMLELGAYWSHYSMWMKNTHPHSKVFMVEPELENIEAGRNNFARHGFDGTFIQAFVGVNHFEVDSFMRETSLRRLNILHADIQGFEAEMLAGCAESFERKAIDHIFVSTHSQSLHERVIRQLTEFNMRVEVTADFDNDSTSYDGLVFASQIALPPLFPDFKPMGRREILASTPANYLNYLSQTNSHIT